jgi:hypothetical protein
LTPIQEPVSWTISGLKLTLLLELKEFPLDDAGALSGLLFDKAPIPLEGGCPGAVVTLYGDHDPTTGGSGLMAGLNALFVDAIFIVGDIVGCKFFSKSCRNCESFNV